MSLVLRILLFFFHVVSFLLLLFLYLNSFFSRVLSEIRIRLVFVIDVLKRRRTSHDCQEEEEEEK
jgi:hypothetical protein